jgi:hypothetical protein
MFFEFFLLASARRRIIAITLLPGGQWNATCLEQIDFVLAGVSGGWWLRPSREQTTKQERSKNN